MTDAPPGPRRLLRRWALLGALALCVAQTVADTHVHLEGHEEEACTVCAISETGHSAEIGRVDAQPTEWRRSDSFAGFSATLPPRPYEVGRPRAPPVS